MNFTRMPHKILERWMLVVLGVLAMASAMHGQGKADFRFRNSKPLAVLHFMHTATGGEHASQTYRAFIDTALAGEADFTALRARYSELDMSSNYRRPNLPRRRYRSRSVMDLLWMQAAVSSSIADFSQRSFGFLNAAQHVELFEVLAKAEPYYEQLVWIPKFEEITRTERMLKDYEGQVAGLFDRVTSFYGTPWPESIPFTTALCPIPLASGVTSAVPKGNVLVCSYLTDNPEEYKSTLGVAVHEMCHSIYDEQPAELQRQIDDWFMLSRSPFATHAYNYFNEGLATAIGNGWAYEQLNGSQDNNAWYADSFIDGYARVLLPIVEPYLEGRRTIDRAFVEAAIAAFAKTFPDADRDFAVLVNSVGIYTDTEDAARLDAFSEALFSRFRIQSSYLRAPLSNGSHAQTLSYPQLTKLLIIDRNHSHNWSILGNAFAEMAGLELPLEDNFVYTFYDKPSRSTVLVFMVEDERGFDHLLEAIRQDRIMSYGQSISIGSAVAGEAQ